MGKTVSALGHDFSNCSIALKKTRFTKFQAEAVLFIAILMGYY